MPPRSAGWGQTSAFHSDDDEDDYQQSSHDEHRQCAQPIVLRPLRLPKDSSQTTGRHGLRRRHRQLRPGLELAHVRAVASGLDGVSFIEGDAQVHPFEPGAFDAVISRFGTMFFDDPVAAFANLRRALRRGGRLAVVAWQGPFESESTAVAVKVAIAHFGHPPDLGAPGGPGPFAFADGDHSRASSRRLASGT